MISSFQLQDGLEEAGFSEEEVEALWLQVLSPGAAEAFQEQLEDFRARVSHPLR